MSWAKGFLPIFVLLVTAGSAVADPYGCAQLFRVERPVPDHGVRLSRSSSPLAPSFIWNMERWPSSSTGQLPSLKGQEIDRYEVRPVSGRAHSSRLVDIRDLARFYGTIGLHPNHSSFPAAAGFSVVGDVVYFPTGGMWARIASEFWKLEDPDAFDLGQRMRFSEVNNADLRPLRVIEDLVSSQGPFFPLPRSEGNGLQPLDAMLDYHSLFLMPEELVMRVRRRAQIWKRFMAYVDKQFQEDRGYGLAQVPREWWASQAAQRWMTAFSRFSYAVTGGENESAIRALLEVFGGDDPVEAWRLESDRLIPADATWAVEARRIQIEFLRTAQPWTAQALPATLPSLWRELSVQWVQPMLGRPNRESLVQELKHNIDRFAAFFVEGVHRRVEYDQIFNRRATREDQ